VTVFDLSRGACRINAYGFGGSGWTVSLGVVKDVMQLVRSSSQSAK
jgi:hypothetical protein